jgi:bifunctional non-homologous end joining protein LigD
MRPPEPALATLSHDPVFGEGWMHERKLDGMRCLAGRDGAGAVLWSRSGRDITAGFPEVAEALAAQRATSFVVDGEIVAFEGPRTSFERLQPRIHASSATAARHSGVAVYYYLFDVLEVDGEDLRDLPLRERKARLRGLLRYAGPLRLTPHRNAAGPAYLADACSKGWEGLIAKQADAAYAPGRSKTWLKLKCEAGQELVIGGYTDPEGSREGIGALLLGYYRDGALRYAGKVGTGFDRATLLDLAQRLGGLEVERSPYDAGNVPSKGVHWVRPELVAQIAFTEWTSAGQLRHPRFLGLRTDKSAREVVRE